MKILAIDFGLKKIGLALFVMGVIMPYQTIENTFNDQTLLKLKKIIQEESISKIIIGFPQSNKEFETTIMKEAKVFISAFKTFLPNMLVEIQNEFYSTKNAVTVYKNSGYKSSRIKKVKDMGAACSILQSYLEKNDIK